VFAPLVWIHKKYPEKVESFAEGLATGEGLLEGSPILKLREMYLMNQMRASQYQQLLQSCYTFSAVRTHVNGRKLKAMRPNFDAFIKFRQDLRKPARCDKWLETAKEYYKRTTRRR
jgi:hypothetical protein